MEEGDTGAEAEVGVEVGIGSQIFLKIGLFNRMLLCLLLLLIINISIHIIMAMVILIICTNTEFTSKVNNFSKTPNKLSSQ